MSTATDRSFAASPKITPQQLEQYSGKIAAFNYSTGEFIHAEENRTQITTWMQDNFEGVKYILFCFPFSGQTNKPLAKSNQLAISD